MNVRFLQRSDNYMSFFYKFAYTYEEFAKLQRKRFDQPAKKTCDTLPHPRVASVFPSWLETTHFQKCMCMLDVLCSFVESIVYMWK